MSSGETSRWTESDLKELASLADQASSESETHFRLATSLPSRDVGLGVSVVVLTTFSCFCLGIVGQTGGLALRLAIGLATSTAFVLASLQAFFRYGVYAAHHHDVAMEWSAIRREINQVLALEPSARQSVDQQRTYLAHLHARTDELAARPPDFGDWRRLLAERWAEFRAVAIAASSRRETWPPRWTEAVRALLDDWEARAVTAMNVHQADAENLASRHRLLSAPVVALTLLVAMCVFTTVGDDLGLLLRMFTFGACLVAAVLASMSTFLRPGARAQQAGRAAARWAGVRRTIARQRSIGTDDEPLDDPMSYLDELRRSMDAISAESPEVGYRQWHKASAPREREAEKSDEAARRFRAVFPRTRLSAPTERSSSSPAEISIT